jgi:hypothetical protein
MEGNAPLLLCRYGIGVVQYLNEPGDDRAKLASYSMEGIVMDNLWRLVVAIRHHSS